jgi:hypothetical protein
LIGRFRHPITSQRHRDRLLQHLILLVSFCDRTSDALKRLTKLVQEKARPDPQSSHLTLTKSSLGTMMITKSSLNPERFLGEDGARVAAAMMMVAPQRSPERILAERNLVATLCRDLSTVLTLSRMRLDEEEPIPMQGSTMREVSILMSKLRRRMGAFEELILAQYQRILVLEHEGRMKMPSAV